MNLSKNQLQFLKELGQNLNPVVIIGNNGLTEAVHYEIENALNIHEIIKIKIRSAEREQIVKTILHITNAIKVQTIGGVLVIYRANKEPRIQLPKAKKVIL